MPDQSIRELKTEQFKIRLAERDAALIRALALRSAIPPAVLLRSWVTEHLHRSSAPRASVASRAGD